jgi:peptidoglycan/LPS O-acetylase OafA/YrhL
LPLGREIGLELAFSIVATLLSFYLVEQPLLLRKQAFSWRRPVITTPLPQSG